MRAAYEDELRALASRLGHAAEMADWPGVEEADAQCQPLVEAAIAGLDQDPAQAPRVAEALAVLLAAQRRAERLCAQARDALAAEIRALDRGQRVSAAYGV